MSWHFICTNTLENWCICYIFLRDDSALYICLSYLPAMEGRKGERGEKTLRMCLYQIVSKRHLNTDLGK